MNCHLERCNIAALSLLVTSIYLFLPVSLSQAQENYPSRSVRIIVPFAPGGAVDILSRTVGQKLNELWGQQVVIDNKPGAGGNLGAELAARTLPDGYSILMGDAAHANAVTLYPKLGYDIMKDFSPITLAAVTPFVIVNYPGLPIKTINDLIALAKSSREPLTLGTGGNGSATHLGAELLMATVGIKFIKVPYKSVPPAIPDLIGGQINLMFLPAPVAQSFVREKKVNAIAITSAQRSNSYLGLPTVAETLPGFEVNTWYGMMVKSGTPASIISRLHRDITAVLKMNDVRERLTGLGSSLVASTPEAFSEHFKSEIVKWGKIIRNAGIEVE